MVALLLGEIFIHKFNSIILTPAGFYAISLCLFSDSFQTTERHSYDGYSIYMPSFNQFLAAVYPEIYSLGVTDLRLFCMKN